MLQLYVFMVQNCSDGTCLMISYNSCYGFFFLIRLNLHWNTQWSQNVRISELRRLVFILICSQNEDFGYFPPKLKL